MHNIVKIEPAINIETHSGDVRRAAGLAGFLLATRRGAEEL